MEKQVSGGGGMHQMGQTKTTPKSDKKAKRPYYDNTVDPAFAEASMMEGRGAYQDFTGGNPLHYQTHVKQKQNKVSNNKKINLHHRGK